MRMTTIRTATLIAIVAWGAVPASAQIAQGPAAPLAASPGDQIRRLSIDDAVRLALENNLGIQIARLDPQIQDLNVALARAAWVPTFSTIVENSSTDTPNTSFLSGSQGNKTTNGRLASNVGIVQQTAWGGSYQIGWDSSRSTTTNLFSNFSPQLQSSLSLNVQQPLLRNFRIDNLRQQVILAEKSRDQSDIQVQQMVAQTARA